MDVSRLPFVLEDLVLEVTKICGGQVDIRVGLKEDDWKRVIGELRSHSPADLVFVNGEAQFHGVTLVRCD